MDKIENLVIAGLMIFVAGFLLWMFITIIIFAVSPTPFQVNEDYTLNSEYSSGENISVKLLDIIKDHQGTEYGFAESEIVYAKVSFNDFILYIKVGGISGYDGCEEEENQLNRAKACQLEKLIGQNITIYQICDY